MAKQSDKRKTPKDINKLAAFIVKLATGESAPPQSKDNK